MDTTQPEQPKKSILPKILATLVFLALAMGGFVAWNFFLKPNVPAVLAEEYVHFPTGSDLDDVVRILSEGGFILDEASLRMMAERLGFKGRAGRFRIEPGMSSYQLVRFLRSGQQSPVKLVLVNERLPEDVAEKAARFIEADSTSIMAVLTSRAFLDSTGFTPQTVMTLFIPNTYEFFWNTSAEKFVERMRKEHEKFWQANDRDAKAAALGLSREEVYTLASIVERETNANSEKARIAGVYLNRLAIDMILQADPTLVFASRDWESRSLAQYKTLDSPYNTYMYTGLPPGPISMASIPSLDAVLEPEKHDYLFFCAIGDGSGLHSFAATYEAHKVNVKRYKENLIKRGMGL